MTAQGVREQIADDPLVVARDPLEAARAHVAAVALRPDISGRVGLELEQHLVDLARPGARPSWQEVQALDAALGPLPCGSAVTWEPGGQVELSTTPQPGLVAAVEALRADRAALARTLAAAGYGAAPLGADPAREVRRTSPRPRYAAMEAYFDAAGCGAPGRAMMSSTAALQVNLDAGPAAGWKDRAALLGALVPVLVAVSAGSTYLAGHASGWRSMRQQAWTGVDPGRTRPVAAGPLGERLAEYALSAPVMMLHAGPGEGEPLRPPPRRLPFGAWLADPSVVGRRATLADLDHHLTTLFPPVRPRGYVEIRCLDALPDRWWPALAALTITLADDPVAADRAAEACAPVVGLQAEAAREGLAHPALRAAVTACAQVAAERAPAPLAADLAALADLVGRGRTPGDELDERAREAGPLRLLEEEARA
jgi:glutamate--cysteine ligase